MGYEVPISESLQQTAGNIGLGQLQTKIKVRLTTKKNLKRNLCLQPSPCSGKSPNPAIKIFYFLYQYCQFWQHSHLKCKLSLPTPLCSTRIIKPRALRKASCAAAGGVWLHTNPCLISTSRRGNEGRVTDRERRFLDDCIWFWGMRSLLEHEVSLPSPQPL